MSDLCEEKDDESSGVQRSWEALADKVRRKLSEQAEYIPAMKPEEVKSLIEAMREAYWIDQYAATFDKRVEVEMSRHAFSD